MMDTAMYQLPVVQSPAKLQLARRGVQEGRPVWAAIITTSSFEGINGGGGLAATDEVIPYEKAAHGKTGHH